MRPVFLALGLAACTGGGGSVLDDLTGREGPPGSRETSAASTEGAPNEREVSSEKEDGVTGETPNPAQPSGNGGATFQCSGRYTCRQAGDDDTTTITLGEANGTCSFSSKEVTVIVRSDGRLAVGEEAVGTWTPTATGFSATLGNDTVACTRN